MAYGISVRERHHHEDALYKIELDVCVNFNHHRAGARCLLDPPLYFISSFGFYDDYRGVPTTTSNISDEGLYVGLNS
jgi:hypothetical protein